MTVYGTDTGDSASGGSFSDVGGSPPGDSSGGYGYGYGYDFIKGKLPQNTTNIASIAGFDATLSAVANNTASSGSASTNDGRSKALQSAVDSASGTSTLGDTLEGVRWSSNVITYSFDNGSFNAQEQSAIESAFTAWSAVSGVKFQQVAAGQQSDIDLDFGNLKTASSGVIGFTSFKSSGGNFEAGTTIELEDPTDTALVNGGNGQLTYTGTNVTLYQVALHEIGHALGLNDTADVNSAMYYGSSTANNQLDATDIANVQLLYGSPTAPVNIGTTKSASATPVGSVGIVASQTQPSPDLANAVASSGSHGTVNQLIQSIAAFNGYASAGTTPQLVSANDYAPTLANAHRLSA
jgi:predicted Zn-dependent protease